MRTDRDTIRGWIGSIVLHLLIALLLFLWQVETTSGEPEFIEVNWGTLTERPVVRPSRKTSAGSQGARVASVLPDKRPVDLPERTFAGPDDILNVPPSRKLEAEDRVAKSSMRVAENTGGQKDRSTGSGTGSKESFARPGPGAFAGDIADPQTGNPAGSDVGSAVSVSMLWGDGGTRKKLSGGLPEYPEGVNVEAQIKIDATVSPDGSVKSLKPAQKGNTRLEDAAMKEVRLWRFEPLKRSSPQRDQHCVITFNFRLQ